MLHRQAQTNLMEAIPQLKFPLRECVQFVSILSMRAHKGYTVWVCPASLTHSSLDSVCFNLNLFSFLSLLRWVTPIKAAIFPQTQGFRPYFLPQRKANLDPSGCVKNEVLRMCLDRHIASAGHL